MDKILVVATHDFGGAGEYAYRLTKAIKQLGNDARLLVKHKSKSDPFIIKAIEQKTQKSILKSIQYKVASKLIRRRKHDTLILDSNYYFFNKDEAIIPSSILSLLNSLPFQPDIIFLTWITDFVNTELAFQLRKHTGAKIYWIMTDMAPITGGCHYAWSCKGYTLDCSNCPAIMTEKYKNRSKHNLSIKKKFIESGNIEVIAGSGWTHNQARISTLFKNQKVIHVINGLIDLSVFNAKNRNVSKQIFDIPQDHKVIFSGATFTGEKRKGISLLVESLKKLYNILTEEDRKKTKILIAGNQLDKNEYVKGIPFQIIPIEFIKDDRLLSLAYQAADVFICPSIEDSGPMMVSESLACGTPVIGFEMGLLHNMVQNGMNGFKVSLGNTTDLAIAIKKVLSLTNEEFDLFSTNAINMVKDQASINSLKKVLSSISRNV